MDKVSIIVPVYRVEEYLERCVNSLLAQTYTNLEILLVDDGSPDRSGVICDDFAAQDDRIVVLHQENQGVSAARNRALDVMSGEWVCFCDGDDWYAPQFVEDMLSCAAENQADYILCDYYVVGDKGPALRAHSTAGLFTGCGAKLAVACGSPYSWTRMIRRELVEKTGIRYPVGFGRSEELPVIPALAAYADKIGVVDKPLYYYFQRSDHSSASNAALDGYEENFQQLLGLLEKAVGAGYERELEYLAIYALFYGGILVRCKQRASSAELRAKLREYAERYPDYGHNPYLERVGFFKRLFIRFECLGWLLPLRVMARLHALLVH